MPGKASRLRIIAAFLLVGGVNAFSQQMKRMEFVNQPITDILLVLSEASGISIIPDETVTGAASFYFSETEFDQALDSFLSTYGLYCTKGQNIYHVSRIYSYYDKNDDTVAMKADNVDIQLLFRALSKSIGKTILYDALPTMAVSINIEGLSPDKTIEVLSKKLGDFRIEKDDSCYYIKKYIPPAANPVPAVQATEEKVPFVTKNGDLYSLSVAKGRFIDVITELFSVSKNEFSLLIKIDNMLENLYFRDKTFNQILRLVLEQVNADYVVSDGVFYIFDVQKKDITKKYKESYVVPLQFITAQDAVNLLPFDLSTAMIRPDRLTNSIVLTGSDEETRPILDFLKKIDKPLNNLRYYRFDMKFLKARDILALIPTKLAPISPLLIPESNAFVALLSEENQRQLSAFISLIDKKAEGYPIYLKYIKSEELIKNLPPSVSKDDVMESASPSLVFFVGTEEKRKNFLREVKLIDKPKPQIRYELLVVQYQRGKGSEFARPKAEFRPTTDVSGLALAGDLSELLSLSFDVISTFGYEFALTLNYSLSSNLAEVFADTTLNGISGQEVKFQNTDTFRYREIETDEDTGKQTYTGVTHEITSGLIISINGWVSGDGMITMQVNTTISKRGTDTTTTTGNPPTTSEKVVTTNVRTMSGKPVIIGGLMQKSKDVSSTKVPFLGDIPLIGALFRSHTEKEENTEMVVYIVPHVTYDEKSDDDSASRRMETYYRSFVEGFVK